MIEPFVIAVAVFLIIIFILKKIRNKKLLGAPESVQPETQESRPDDKVVTPVQAALQAEETPHVSSEFTQVAQIVETVASNVDAEHKPAVIQPATATKVVYKNRNVPQDSMLRRHYLTHLHAMIAELNQTTCPTDSMLHRHYDAHIASKMEQYLNDEEATKQLIACYENYKKNLAFPPQKLKVSPTVADYKHSKIPEDSMLRRHFLANLYVQIANNLPARPTDSSLRRHYNTMLEHEVKKQLCF
jgi:hypothetical protein